jgi:hypothetical protein
MNAPRQVLGSRPSFGTTPATLWTPKRYLQHQEFTATARGGQPPASAFSGPKGIAGADAETKMDSLCAAVAHAFGEHGYKSGMDEARRYGLGAAAQFYVDIRTETEEQLAVRLAGLRAALGKDKENRALQARRAFVELRLAQVRAAVSKGQTPSPSVADRPEVPRREVKRWVPYAALAVGVIALVRSMK